MCTFIWSIVEEMTKGKIKQTITLSSTMPIIWPKSESNTKSNTTYILTGAGAVISVLLFILVLQSCKKSRSIQRNNINQDRKNEAKIGYASSNRFQHENDRPCSKMSCIKSGCSHHQMESKYDEINECLKFVQAPVFKNDFESSNTAPGDVNELSCTEELSLNADDSDFYLQPVFSHDNKKEGNSEEIHPYIDIID